MGQSMKNILFLCTGNSCRSQMAEAFAIQYFKKYCIKSAGTNPEPVNHLAIQVMKEVNIDISKNHSKSISNDEIKTFDIAITLCGDAQDKCSNLNNLVKQHIHWNIIDPAKSQGSNEEKLNTFREVRNLIENNIQKLAHSLIKSH